MPDDEGRANSLPWLTIDYDESRANDMRTLAILFLRGYQFLISPILPPSCRFYPSCSEYTLQAVRKYGVGKGMWLGLKRLLRCNPFSPGGIDELS